MCDLQLAIRVCMARENINQTELAERCGVSTTAVRQWLTHGRDLRLSTMTRLAIVFNMKLSEFVKLGEG